MLLELAALAITLAMGGIEQSKLQGEWVPISDQKRTGFSLTVQGSNLISRYWDESRPRPPVRCKIVYPLQNPKGIDLVSADGVTKCIYEVERDRLRLGMPFMTLAPIPKHERPTHWGPEGKDVPVILDLRRKAR